MNILILGNAEDVHARHLKTALNNAGATVHYFDTRLFPTKLQLSWQPGTQIGRLTLPDGHCLNLLDIKAVFWRNFSGVYVPQLKDEAQERIAFNDAMSVVRSIMQAFPAPWINSWQAYQFHKEKPLQLSKVQQLGVPIPKTLISNAPNQVIEFAQSLEQVIFKPVYGGAHLRRLCRPRN